MRSLVVLLLCVALASAQSGLWQRNPTNPINRAAQIAVNPNASPRLPADPICLIIATSGTAWQTEAWVSFLAARGIRSELRTVPADLALVDGAGNPRYNCILTFPNGVGIMGTGNTQRSQFVPLTPDQMTELRTYANTFGVRNVLINSWPLWQDGMLASNWWWNFPRGGANPPRPEAEQRPVSGSSLPLVARFTGVGATIGTRNGIPVPAGDLSFTADATPASNYEGELMNQPLLTINPINPNWPQQNIAGQPMSLILSTLVHWHGAEELHHYGALPLDQTASASIAQWYVQWVSRNSGGAPLPVEPTPATTSTSATSIDTTSTVSTEPATTSVDTTSVATTSVDTTSVATTSVDT
eukprot:Colp12_sorted_trinity150504_noHs@29339